MRDARSDVAHTGPSPSFATEQTGLVVSGWMHAPVPQDSAPLHSQWIQASMRMTYQRGSLLHSKTGPRGPLQSADQGGIWQAPPRETVIIISSSGNLHGGVSAQGKHE